MTADSAPPTPPARPFVGAARVLAGAGTSARIGEELLATGVQPASGAVLVVVDAAVLDLGLAAPALAGLEAAGFDVRVGPAVAREPSPETIEALVAAAAGGPVAAVLGIGGGSAIDAAKLACVSLTNAIELTAGLAPTVALGATSKLLAVPTTAGTGAEVTSVAMLWHEGRKRIFVHDRLVPSHATLDLELLAKSPPPVTAASGLDAISHAVESLLSTFRSPLSEARSRSALRHLSHALPAAFAGEPSAHGEMLLGAHEAGLGLNASVAVGHSIAYAIAGQAGLSHGVSCAMALPYCLAYCRPASEDQLVEMAPWAGLEPEPKAMLDWIVELNDDLGIPGSLAEVGIDVDAIPTMAREVVELYPRPNNPVPVELESLEALFVDFYNGHAQEAWSRHAARAGSAAS
jgi:alcohol dehydrogenase class IV